MINYLTKYFSCSPTIHLNCGLPEKLIVYVVKAYQSLDRNKKQVSETGALSTILLKNFHCQISSILISLLIHVSVSSIDISGPCTLPDICSEDLLGNLLRPCQRSQNRYHDDNNFVSLFLRHILQVENRTDQSKIKQKYKVIT